MPSKFEYQSTDAENSKAPGGSRNAGDDLKQLANKSSQAIANDTANQNTASGSGGDAVTAKAQAGS